jgi:hypothetical protein
MRDTQHKDGLSISILGIEGTVVRGLTGHAVAVLIRIDMSLLIDYRLTGGIRLQRKLILFFICGITGLFALSPASFGQDQTQQPVQMQKQAPVLNSNALRLQSHYAVKPAAKANVEATKNQMGTVSAGKSLPLSTFFIESSRDHRAYEGVMVGADPFNGGGRSTFHVHRSTYN